MSASTPVAVSRGAAVDARWAGSMAAVLRRNGLSQFATVPDNVIAQVLQHLYSDPGCRVVTVTREEEGVGLVTGAFLGGVRGAVLMQHSGLGLCLNTLASLNVAHQLPVVLVLSHRGDLGEFNPAEVPLGRAVPDLLDALSIRFVSPRTVAELEAEGDGLIKLAYTSNMPVAFLLPWQLTGGKG